MNKEVELEKKVDKKIKDCFVIMPIAENDNYDPGHFSKVYEDIFKPACESAGFRAVRADDVTQTNLIHEDILRKLIESPIAICDLSSRNPNVLFELGLRQAFDKPTVLVQEKGTPRIFDIAPLRYTEYRKELRYREVLEDQKFIQSTITSTWEAAEKGEGINSIVRILSLSAPAKIKPIDESDTLSIIKLMRAEMSEMRSDLRKNAYELGSNNRTLSHKVDYSDSFQAGTRVIFELNRSIEMAEEAFKNARYKEALNLVDKAKSFSLSLIDSNNIPEKIDLELKNRFIKLNNLEKEINMIIDLDNKMRKK